MKTTISTLSMMILAIANLFAQATETMNVNNVKVVVNNSGALFWDGQNGQFIAPYEPGQPEISTMKAAGIWLAGLDEGGNVKGAVQQYNENGNSDFQPGPLNADGSTTDFLQGIYKVTSADIEAHLTDFNDNGVVDNPNPAVFGWPGSWNSFFPQYHNGEQLPMTYQGFAPYYDNNGNGQYNPDQGDYPTIHVRGCEEVPISTPDEILWFVFNDNKVHTESGMEPIKMEIQCTAFGFNCLESPLSNSVFFNFRMINKSQEDIDGMHFGVFSDFDIGNPDDDFFGSDSDRNLVFGYNGDANDDGGYGTDSPVMVLDLFRGPRDETNQETPLAHLMPVETTLTSPAAYYYLLNGQYADGSNAPNNGFFYDGNPTIPGEWSEVSEGNAPGDRKVTASYGPFKLQPGAVNELLLGFSFYNEEGNTPLQNLELMYSEADALQSVFDNCFGVGSTPVCTPNLTPATEVIRQSIQLFPNPASQFLSLEMPQGQIDAVVISSLDGRVVFTEKIETNVGITKLDISRLPAGFYVLEGVKIGQRVAQEKLVLMR